MAFEAGQRVRLPGENLLRTIEMASETPQGWQLFVDDGSGSYRKVLRRTRLRIRSSFRLTGRRLPSRSGCAGPLPVTPRSSR